MGEGPNSVGVYTDGVPPGVPSISLTGSGIDLHSGHVMFAQITYDGTNLKLTLTDTASLSTWSHAFAVSIPAAVGADMAYIGFTGGTGGSTAIQEILNWTYISGQPGPAAAAPAIPALPSFPDAVNTQGLLFNGSAQISGATLQLTESRNDEPVTKNHQAASVYYAKPVNIQSFTTDFTFLLRNTIIDHSNAQYRFNIGDGFTFTIQNAGPTALGGDGSGLGYVGIPKSVALKFDIHGYFDNVNNETANSIGLYVDGALPTTPDINQLISCQDGVGGEVCSYIDLGAERAIAAHVSYDGTTLTLTLTDTVTQATFTQSFAIDIPATVGGQTAYVGFTGSTGDDTETQQILTWTFSNP
jgi:Legume lectin domain